MGNRLVADTLCFPFFTAMWWRFKSFSVEQSVQQKAITQKKKKITTIEPAFKLCPDIHNHHIQSAIWNKQFLQLPVLRLLGAEKTWLCRKGGTLLTLVAANSFCVTMWTFNWQQRIEHRRKKRIEEKREVNEKSGD